MFNLQGSEIIVILLLALVVLGPEKLPDAVRRFTQTYAEFKKMSRGFQSELKAALDEPMREMRKTADLVRDAADPSKIIAEAEAEQRVLHDADAAVGLAGPTPADDWSAPAPSTPTPSEPLPVESLPVEPPPGDPVAGGPAGTAP